MVTNVLISPLNFNCGYSLVLMSTHKIYFCREIEKYENLHCGLVGRASAL